MSTVRIGPYEFDRDGGELLVSREREMFATGEGVSDGEWDHFVRAAATRELRPVPWADRRTLEDLRAEAAASARALAEAHDGDEMGSFHLNLGYLHGLAQVIYAKSAREEGDRLP